MAESAVVKTYLIGETATLRRNRRTGFTTLSFSQNLVFLRKEEIISFTPIGVIDEVVGTETAYDFFYSVKMTGGKSYIIGFISDGGISLSEGQLGAPAVPGIYPDIVGMKLMTEESVTAAGVTLKPAHIGNSEPLEYSMIPNTAVRSIELYNKNVISSPETPILSAPAPAAISGLLGEGPAIDYLQIFLNNGDRYVVTVNSFFNLVDGGNWSPINGGV